MTDFQVDSSKLTFKGNFNERIKIYIEHCTGCESHQWCTYHKSEKYSNYLAKVKESINREIPDCIIIENDLPEEKSSKLTKTYDKRLGEYVCRYTTKKGYKTDFPRVGAFEVYFKHKTIFSKLKSSLWPHPDTLASKLSSVINNMRNGKSWLEGVNLKDMSESEPEVEEHEIAIPKSSFVIPKVPRKVKSKNKSAKSKPKGENVFITNPMQDNNSEYSEVEEDHHIKSTENNKKSPSKQNKDENDEYEDDYENEFEDDNNSKEKDNSANKKQEEFESEYKNPKSCYKDNKKYEENKIKTNKSAINASGSLNKSQNRVSSIKKTDNSSKFNTRVSTSNQASNPRRKILNQAPSTKRYDNLNKSSTADRKSRPNTYGNKSQLNLSNHVTSSTNIKSNNRSISRK